MGIFILLCSGTETVEAKLREENVQAVYHTMSILKNGQDEATVRKDIISYSSLGMIIISENNEI